MKTENLRNIIQRRNQENESGQAFTELVVALIGILIVFSGFLMISGLSIEGIENLIQARGRADDNAQGGILSSANAQYIRSWDYGPNDIPFTYSDKPIASSMADGAIFVSNLNDNTGLFMLGALSTNTTYVPAHNNFASDLAAGNIFISAAQLTGGRSTEGDPLGKRNLGELKNLINKFFIGGDITLTDTVYMPINTYLEGNEF